MTLPCCVSLCENVCVGCRGHDLHVVQRFMRPGKKSVGASVVKKQAWSTTFYGYSQPKFS